MVCSPKTRVRISPATVSGATRASRPLRSRSATQTTSCSLRAAIRSAMSKTSLTAAAACRQSGSFLSPPFVRALTTRRVTDRTVSQAATKGLPGSSTRSRGTSSSASRSVSAQVNISAPRSSSSSQLSARLPTRSTIPGLSSADAAPVTRAVSSCASSISTAWCSGRAVPPCMASIASSAWLVTTRSAARASSRDFSTKQRPPCGHCWVPRHSRTGIDTCCQPRSVCDGASSRSASPPWSTCSSAHSRSASTSAPRADSGAARGASCKDATSSEAGMSAAWSSAPSRTFNRHA